MDNVMLMAFFQELDKMATALPGIGTVTTGASAITRPASITKPLSMKVTEAKNVKYTQPTSEVAPVNDLRASPEPPPVRA